METRLNIRITPEVKEMVQKLAKADNRDVTSYVTNFIKKEYEKMIKNT